MDWVLLQASNDCMYTRAMPCVHAITLWNSQYFAGVGNGQCHALRSAPPTNSNNFVVCLPIGEGVVGSMIDKHTPAISNVLLEILLNRLWPLGATPNVITGLYDYVVCGKIRPPILPIIVTLRRRCRRNRYVE